LDPEECEARRQFWTDKLRKYASVLEQNAGAFDFLNEVAIIRGRIPLLDFEPSDPNSRPDTDYVGESRPRDGAAPGVT
jgi:hypothetical protein